MSNTLNPQQESNKTNLFYLKNDITKIINSSNELRKSEAIADGFAILLHQIEKYEKIVNDYINERLIMKEKNEELMVVNSKLTKEIHRFKVENQGLNDELLIKNKYIEENKEKIIKFDMIFIDLSRKDSQIHAFQCELDRFQEKITEKDKENQSLLETIDYLNKEINRINSINKDSSYINTNTSPINNIIESIETNINPNLISSSNEENNEEPRKTRKIIQETSKDKKNQRNKKFNKTVKDLYNDYKDILDTYTIKTIDDLMFHINQKEDTIKNLNSKLDDVDLPIDGSGSMRNSTNSLCQSKNFIENFSKAKEIIDRIEYETSSLIKLKCVYNKLV